MIRSLTVTVGGTYNIGNYESVRMEVAMERTFTEGTSAADELEQMREWLSDQLNNSLVPKEIEARKQGRR
jgi:hypothetical protein